MISSNEGAETAILSCADGSRKENGREGATEGLLEVNVLEVLC